VNHTIKVTRRTPPPPPPAKIAQVTATCHSGMHSSRETITVLANDTGISHMLTYSHSDQKAPGEIYLNSDELRDFAIALMEIADTYPNTR
jgi:hypothetical protein